MSLWKESKSFELLFFRILAIKCHQGVLVDYANGCEMLDDKCS